MCRGGSSPASSMRGDSASSLSKMHTVCRCTLSRNRSCRVDQGMLNASTHLPWPCDSKQNFAGGVRSEQAVHCQGNKQARGQGKTTGLAR